MQSMFDLVTQGVLFVTQCSRLPHNTFVIQHSFYWWRVSFTQHSCHATLFLPFSTRKSIVGQNQRLTSPSNGYEGNCYDASCTNFLSKNWTPTKNEKIVRTRPKIKFFFDNFHWNEKFRSLYGLLRR